MVPLVVGVVVIVQFVWIEQAEVLVSLSRVPDLGGFRVHALLQHPVIFVSFVGWEPVYYFSPAYQLVSVPSGLCYCFFERDLLLLYRASGHPRLRLAAVIDAELQGATAGNAAELGRKLFIVLELQP